MSVCTFIASAQPLEEVRPPRDYPLEIDLDSGTVFDGGADDNFFLSTFADAPDYTDKPYAVSLDWHYTEGRARRLMDYIKAALEQSGCVELWHVWLTGYCEYEESPVLHRRRISFRELTPAHIREMDEAELWNTPDRSYPGRPSFYCLEIRNQTLK